MAKDLLYIALFLIGSTTDDTSYYAGLPTSEATVLENIGFSIGYSERHKNPF